MSILSKLATHNLNSVAFLSVGETLYINCMPAGVNKWKFWCTSKDYNEVIKAESLESAWSQAIHALISK
jgi:hypothetical protein